jgi:putative endonuclease
MKSYWVYIVASKSGVIYVGMTNDLARRLAEHKGRPLPGFTEKYNCDRLVWFEEFHDVNAAIAMERRIKGWRRSKKDALIAEKNPMWTDLSITGGDVAQLDSEIPQVATAPLGMTGPRSAASRLDVTYDGR